MIRPTPLLRAAQATARPASVALDPRELGAARATRHSFARSLLRTAARERWQVITELFDVDDQGHGDVRYAVQTPHHRFTFVAFTTTIPEQERTDRVVAQSWDVTAALVEGTITAAQVEQLRLQVPQQEAGRAHSGALVWTRANRSARFFDYVVDQLASGRQPDVAVLGDAAYVLRSTAFYANGKWGLTDFDGFGVEHPLALPYRAQMLAAWLMRELSLDLVEHCAVRRTATAARLDDSWRRFFGLGNATGLGMVPYVVNHPQVLDAWVALHELPLAHALALDSAPGSAATARTAQLLVRAVDHFSERDTLATAPYLTGADLAVQLLPLVALAQEYVQVGSVLGQPVPSLARLLHAAADEIGAEVRHLVDAVLVEVQTALDDDVQRLLHCAAPAAPTLAQTCGALLQRLREDYAWTAHFDFTHQASSHFFWFFSFNNQEPRRGVRGVDPGEHVEQPLDVARAVQELIADLATLPGAASLADFLLAHPWHRGALERAQGLAGVPYGEARVNLLSEDFLPLDLQRFQLAAYGMEHFSPQSTDWLRVTLFGGAPRAADIAEGVDGDWFLTCKPRTKAS